MEPGRFGRQEMFAAGVEVASDDDAPTAVVLGGGGAAASEAASMMNYMARFENWHSPASRQR